MSLDIVRVGWRRAASLSDRLGHCYELAARYVQDHGGTLVHGSIEGMGNPRIGHAWVEKLDGTIYDAVLDQDFDPKVWRLLAKPLVDHRYSQERVFIHLLRHEHWGPWDDGRTASVGSIATEPVALDYPYGGRPVRLAIHDSDAPPTKDPYHPGDLVAFLDLFEQGEVVFIAYMHTRGDYGGQGLGRRLVQAAYDRYPGRIIDWGKIMDERAGTLWEDFRKRYPDGLTRGKVWFR